MSVTRKSTTMISKFTTLKGLKKEAKSLHRLHRLYVHNLSRNMYATDHNNVIESFNAQRFWWMPKISTI